MANPLAYLSVICLGSLSLFGTMATAQQGHPGPDLGKIATQLSVPQSALESCMGDRPKPGKRPERPDASKIASCLTEAGHSVSARDVDAALASAAPARR